jgi:hypothetical protein
LRNLIATEAERVRALDIVAGDYGGKVGCFRVEEIGVVDASREESDGELNGGFLPVEDRFLFDAEDEALKALPVVSGVIHHDAALAPKRKTKKVVTEDTKADVQPRRKKQRAENTNNISSETVGTMLECLAAWMGEPCHAAASKLMQMTQGERTALRRQYAQAAPEGMLESNV